MMELGEFLRQARLRLGISLREFARMHGKSYTYLGNVERSVVSPSLAQIRELSAIYGVEPFEAVSGMTKEDLVRQVLGPGPWADPEVQELVALMARPTAKQEIQQILAIAREHPERLAGVLGIMKIMRENGMIPPVKAD